MTTTLLRPAAPIRVRREWWIPASLLALTFVPVAAGVFRVAELATGEANETNQRFFDMPVPVVVHVFGACIYCVLGAFRFMPSSADTSVVRAGSAAGRGTPRANHRRSRSGRSNTTPTTTSTPTAARGADRCGQAGARPGARAGARLTGSAG